MAEKKTIAYWSILLVVVLVAGAFLFVNSTQARYVSTAVWNTIVLPGEETVTSDCLRTVSDAPITVLLGEISQESQKNAQTHQADFWMESAKSVTGALTWSVDKPEYLQVTMHMGATQLQQGGVVALEENEPVTVTMNLTATETAGTQAHGAMTVKVNVSWGGVLQGAFTIDLAEVIPQESVLPEENPDTQEPTQPEKTEPPGEEGTEPVETEPTDPSVEETERPTEAVIEEPVQTIGNESVVQIKTIKGFTKDALLPVMVATDNKTDRLELGVVSQDGTQQTGFPEKTCYSLDQGQSYYMLYWGGQIRLPVQESQSVLLDLSRTDLQESVLNLQLNAYQNGVLQASAQTATVLSTEALYQLDSRILKDKETLQIRLNSQWADYTVAYSMEKMTAATTELGDFAQYLEIDPALAGFVITVTEDPAGDVITVTGAEQRPEAGSYVLHIQWSDSGVTFGQTRIPFFVNYYTETHSQTEPETGTIGGAEQ